MHTFSGVAERPKAAGADQLLLPGSVGYDNRCELKAREGGLRGSVVTSLKVDLYL
jgi:hypothetical protein